ncbi:GDSL esterase/lipase [Striga hermonthica]|uniref:GDSL esterase/lipase n=1 Tax=Striga hermonthica TaxID=68872 RepID=A0A9N7NQS9_STRHE|nr:GDSL esterase/lipase [Striga hermonthica]
MAFKNYYIHLLTIISLTATRLLQPGLTSASPNITAVFAFGDSILDPGNNNHIPTVFRSNHLPYGLDFPGRIPTGRFSDGKLPMDLIVDHLGIKDLLPAYLDPALNDSGLLTGASFASAGMGLDDLTAAEAHVLTMNAQLGYFKQALGRMTSAVGREEAGRVVGNAVFVVGAGTNDMLYNFYLLPVRRGMTVSCYQDLLLTNLKNAITRLHGMGARRVAVIGLPPVGCLPVQVMVGSLSPSPHMFKRVCVDKQNSDSQAYNTKLQGMLSRLGQTLPGSRIAYVDIYNPIMDMINSPAAYGFERTLDGCCGVGSIEMGPLCNELVHTCRDPSKYIFWDAAHPTQAAYTVLSRNFQNNVLPALLS